MNHSFHKQIYGIKEQVVIEVLVQGQKEHHKNIFRVKKKYTLDLDCYEPVLLFYRLIFVIPDHSVCTPIAFTILNSVAFVELY